MFQRRFSDEIEKKIAEDYTSGYLRDEIFAKYEGCTGKILANIFKRQNVKIRSKAETWRIKQDIFPPFTPEQTDFIIGNLLGDGSLCMPKINSCNSIFRIGQKQASSEYVKYLYNVYLPYSSSYRENIKQRKPTRGKNGKVIHDINLWNGEYCYSCYMITMRHPIFTELRKKWYENPYGKSKKIIPKDLQLNYRICSIWAADDGSNDYKNRLFKLCTEAFSIDEVEFLIHCLKRDLNIDAYCNLDKGKPVLKMSGYSYDKFISGIKPYFNFECFQYKVASRPSLRLNPHGENGIYYNKVYWEYKRRLGWFPFSNKLY